MRDGRPMNVYACWIQIDWITCVFSLSLSITTITPPQLNSIGNDGNNNNSTLPRYPTTTRSCAQRIKILHMYWLYYYTIIVIRRRRRRRRCCCLLLLLLLLLVCFLSLISLTLSIFVLSMYTVSFSLPLTTVCLIFLTWKKLSICLLTIVNTQRSRKTNHQPI